jgi:parallel beta-helix repeat protein
MNLTRIKLVALLVATSFASFAGGGRIDIQAKTDTVKANQNISANIVQDDTKALQALIDQCPTNGTVSIPAGTYMIDAVISLNLKSNMTLKMESGTILKAIPNSSISYNIIKVKGAANINIDGGTVQGERDNHLGTTGEWGMGIGIYGGTNIKITGVTAKDCWGDGFFVGYHNNTIIFDNVTADNNRRQGLSNSGGNNVLIKNSTFKNTHGTAPQYGIDIEPDKGFIANDNQIINCQFTGNKGGGIDVNGMWSTLDNPSTINNLIITGNTCSDNAQRGMNIVRTTGKHHIYNNICFNNGANGINLIRTTGNNVHENKVYNNTGIGIAMDAGSTNNTISGNAVFGNTTGQITEVSGNTIKDNKVTPSVQR